MQPEAVLGNPFCSPAAVIDRLLMTEAKSSTPPPPLETTEHWRLWGSGNRQPGLKPVSLAADLDAHRERIRAAFALSAEDAAFRSELERVAEASWRRFERMGEQVVAERAAVSRVLEMKLGPRERLEELLRIVTGELLKLMREGNQLEAQFSAALYQTLVAAEGENPCFRPLQPTEISFDGALAELALRETVRGGGKQGKSGEG
ncbi:MAG: hypothetical protein ACRD2B_05455 [Terriglobia bacterium]